MFDEIERLKNDILHHWVIITEFSNGEYIVALLRDVNIQISEYHYQNIPVEVMVYTIRRIINSCDDMDCLFDEYLKENPNCPFVAKGKDLKTAILNMNNNLLKQDMDFGCVKLIELYKNFGKFLVDIYQIVSDEDVYNDVILEKRMSWKEIKKYIKLKGEKYDGKELNIEKIQFISGCTTD